MIAVSEPSELPLSPRLLQDRLCTETGWPCKWFLNNEVLAYGTNNGITCLLLEP